MKGRMSKRSHSRKCRRAAFRNKILFLLTALSIALGVGMLAGDNLANAYDSSLGLADTKCYTSVELQDGDTLWTIAETYMDESYESVEAYIEELKEINQLQTSDIQKGCYLTVAYNGSPTYR